jgi:hypothetical protein
VRGQFPAAHAAEQLGLGILKATPEQLAALAPLAGLSRERLAELGEVAQVERAQRGVDPLADRLQGNRSVFLLAGEVLLYLQGGGTLVIVGGSDDTRMALNRRRERVARARAITDCDLLVLDDELLDILATWDQVAAAGPEGTVARLRGDPLRSSGPFSLGSLRSGAFSQLPAARIDELLRRFERVAARRG